MSAATKARPEPKTSPAYRPEIPLDTDAVDALLASLAYYRDATAPWVPNPGAAVARVHVENTIRALTQRDDAAVGLDAFAQVMRLLWPHAWPETIGQASWWNTPLGRLCARHAMPDPSRVVSRAVAAEMLGVHESTIQTYVERGRLSRDHRKIYASAVLTRIADYDPTPRVDPINLAKCEGEGCPATATLNAYDGRGKFLGRFCPRHSPTKA